MIKALKLCHLVHHYSVPEEPDADPQGTQTIEAAASSEISVVSTELHAKLHIPKGHSLNILCH